MTPPRNLSPQGALFIARFEGYRARVYADANGDATIGYGHRLHAGPPTTVDRAKFVGKQAALAMLHRDAEDAADAIVRLVHPPIQSQPRFDALCSFVYNVGWPRFERSQLLQDLNSGHRGAAFVFELERWIRGDHGVLPGLVERRKAEARLWLELRYS